LSQFISNGEKVAWVRTASLDLHSLIKSLLWLLGLLAQNWYANQWIMPVNS